MMAFIPAVSQSSPAVPQAHASFRLEPETFHWLSQALCKMQRIHMPSDSQRGRVFSQTPDPGSYTLKMEEPL